MEFINVDNLFCHLYKTQPQYIWLRHEDENKCYKIKFVDIVEKKIKNIVLENGKWLAPIPLADRKNMNKTIKEKYADYTSIKMYDGKNFLDSLKNRKDSSDIVAWKKNNQQINITFENMKQLNLDFILNQEWKCRYCGHINKGGLTCKGISQGNMPSGGPKKANNNALSEYEYFVTKTFSCQPNIYPFKYEFNLGWYELNNIKKYTQIVKGKPCNAKRCIHYSHINQSDQILSFPRIKWNDNKYIKNTYQYFLPGCMLGHQITCNENICSKCRNQINIPNNIPINIFRKEIEHSWWILELLYWLKVDIYNKKMQKLNIEQANQRYIELINSIKKLYTYETEDFVYHGKNGFYQTNTFKNILNVLNEWMKDKKNYIFRFNKKKNKLSLKF